MNTHLTGKDFTIGLLSVTALILLTSLILLHALAPTPALASGQGGAVGDYVVSTGRLDGTTEMLFVVDTATRQMNMYGFLPARGTIELVQQFDMRALEDARLPAGAPEDERAPRRTR